VTHIGAELWQTRCFSNSSTDRRIVSNLQHIFFSERIRHSIEEKNENHANKSNVPRHACVLGMSPKTADIVSNSGQGTARSCTCVAAAQSACTHKEGRAIRHEQERGEREDEERSDNKDRLEAACDAAMRQTQTKKEKQTKQTNNRKQAKARKGRKRDMGVPFRSALRGRRGSCDSW
jgi:hypothetical protein